RSQEGRVLPEKSQGARPLTEAFGRTQQAAQGRSLTLGDVDADVLHQPGRQEPSGIAQAGSATRHGRVAPRLRPRLEPFSAASPGTRARSGRTTRRPGPRSRHENTPIGAAAPPSPAARPSNSAWRRWPDM